MRGAAIVLVLGLMVWSACSAEARERSIRELPKDVWNVAFLWTEPLKQAAEQTRRGDPISGLWFGLLDGSRRSLERTAKFLLDPQGDGETNPEASKQLRYSF